MVNGAGCPAALTECGAMLRFADCSLARAGRLLVSAANLTVDAGRRVGVVGANGAGKSSLFAALRGELAPERGDIVRPPGWVIAHVAQEMPAATVSALDWVLDGDREYRRLARLLETTLADEAAPEGTGAALAEAHERMAAIGGYAAPARAAGLLAGLGFTEADAARPVAAFSGGWRMRLNLAQALMCRSDLLLLDEPTNHLDLDAVLWLEDWLGRYPGTLFVISHDRDFLDRATDCTLHFEPAGPEHGSVLRLYSGNYSAFETQRAQALAVQQAARERQQRQIRHLEAFINRFRAKATKARQAQSRIKALSRLEHIAPAHVDSPFSFRFFEPKGDARQLIRFEGVRLGYGETVVLDQVELSLLPTARIGLLGRNGAGKSTLVKALAGVLTPSAGMRREAHNLRVAYFAQHQLEQLSAVLSPLAHLDRLDLREAEAEGRARAREQDLRDFLGGFDFRGDRVVAPVGSFSGGEKARLALALLVYARPNLLLLDEPTNHLDIEMRHALTMALQDYSGALVVVAHDRHILSACCDEFWLVGDGRVTPFDGDLDDYRQWLVARRSQPAAPAAAAASPSRRDERRAEAEERQRVATLRRPLQRRIEAIERELATLCAERDRIDAWLADEAAYAAEEASELAARTRRRGELARRIEALENDWLAAHEELQQTG